MTICGLALGRPSIFAIWNLIRHEIADYQVVRPPCPMIKNLRISYERTRTPTKFANLRFANYQKKIAEL